MPTLCTCIEQEKRSKKEIRSDELYPQPLLDELLINSGIDPADGVFKTVRKSTGKGRAPAYWVKAAIAPYLVPEECTGDSFYEPVIIPEAECYARQLNREDMSRVAVQLFGENAAGNLSKVNATAMIRYLSDDELRKRVIKPYGYSSFSDRGDHIRAAISLNESRAAMEWCTENMPSIRKYYSPLPKYIRARCGNPPLDAKLPDFLKKNEDGDVVLGGRKSSLLGIIEDGLVPKIQDSATGKTWQRFPTKTALSPEDYKSAAAVWKLFSMYLKELKYQLDEYAFTCYWKGTQILPAEFLKYFENALLKQAFCGIVFTQGYEEFSYAKGLFIDQTGSPFELKPDAPVKVAHVRDLGMEKMQRWKDLFVSLGVTPWMLQLSEPFYEKASIDSKRYKGMYIRALNLRTAGGTHFLLDTLARQRKERKLDYFCGKFQSEVQIVNLRFDHIDREVNTLLYFLDLLSSEDQIRQGNQGVIPALEGLSNRKLTNLMAVAQEERQTAFAAAILEILESRKKQGASLADIFSI